MGIYFEPSVAWLHGRLISGSNPVGPVCPGGWQQALSAWSCGVFIKCEELEVTRHSTSLFLQESGGRKGSETFRKPAAYSYPASSNFLQIVDPHELLETSFRKSNLIFTLCLPASAFVSNGSQWPIYCVQSLSCALPHVILTTALGNGCQCTHFTGEEAESPSGVVICSQTSCVSGKAETCPQSLLGRVWPLHHTTRVSAALRMEDLPGWEQGSSAQVCSVRR